MSKLQCLTGLTVKTVAKVHDYLQVVFSDDSTLSVYNNYRFTGCSISSIEGEEVIEVLEGDVDIELAFKSGGSFSIGLSDGDFNGPEAVAFLRTGEPPVIWN